MLYCKRNLIKKSKNVVDFDIENNGKHPLRGLTTEHDDKFEKLTVSIRASLFDDLHSNMASNEFFTERFCRSFICKILKFR